LAGLHAIARELTKPHVLVALGVVSFFAFLATVILVPLLLVRLPADYLLREDHDRKRSAVVTLLKNIAGVMLVLLGIAMLVLPGQGLLTLVFGLTLVDFPGRRRLECYLMTRPAVLKPINALRRRASRPPLKVPPA
jgi:hypothetical protein